jgi:hypothetical protein
LRVGQVRLRVVTAKVCTRSPVLPIFSVTDRSTGDFVYLINDTSARRHRASRQATALKQTLGEEDYV